MSKQDLTKSRWGIGLHYLSLVFIIVLMELINRFNFSFDIYLAVLALLSIAFWAISFYRIYWKSKWWKYVHQATDKYDERELNSVGEAMRKAYSAFAITLGLMLLIYAVADWTISGLIVALVIYFAHILPASILKWQGYKI